MNQHPLWHHVSENEPRLHALSNQVWATPETCYAETESAAAHLAELRHQGFAVQEQVAGIPTAIMGEAGEGGPIIAFLGEYDALAGLSQQADVFEEMPLEAGANGHGCGHNLLGSSAMLAAVALRDWLKATGTPGRVRYYGCPAEEGGAAKAFMVRAGVFADVDAAITWHPGTMAGVVRGSSLANCRLDVTFHGKASHAAASPHLGRSALDAAELMSVGVNYMREHMPDSARIHHAIIDAGGISPNVVQSQAKLRYVVRDRTTGDMLKLLARVEKIAEGAALMTETKATTQVLAGVSNLIFNPTLGDVMQANLDLLGPPPFDAADRDYAAKIQATVDEDAIEASYAANGLPSDLGPVLAEFVVPATAKPVDIGGSTDVADVSWVVPTVQLWGATYTIGTQLHSWQVVAQGKSQIALKGMTHAAMVMASTGADLMTNPELRARAWADLKAAVGPKGYVSPLPEGTEPPIAAMTQ